MFEILSTVYKELYDDGPITIDDQMVVVKTLNGISAWRLAEMINKYPTLKKSWESFLIDYNVCFSNEQEVDDDIPF